MRTHSSVRSTRQGFTLVELLVVIGIIALLISILLPALNKARKQALIVSELSGMRQVGLAVAMYANDNKGRLPGGYGNAGLYMNSHEVVRERLFGYSFDPNAWQFVKGGTPYLAPSMLLPGPDAWGPSSKVWGCPVNNDAGDGFRYGSSWWWNVGPQGTCDMDGRMIYCRQSDPTISVWSAPPTSDDPRGTKGGLWADAYAVFITGKGFAYDQYDNGNAGVDHTKFDNNSDPAASGPKPVPVDKIVILTDAGAALYPGAPAVGHLRKNAANRGDVEGACSLFLSGAAMWRPRSQLQWNVWIGDNSTWVTGCR
jgi:prepilin-type N-terminal cleavage/methylation domain-containing protein